VVQARHSGRPVQARDNNGAKFAEGRFSYQVSVARSFRSHRRVPYRDVSLGWKPRGGFALKRIIRSGRNALCRTALLAAATGMSACTPDRPAVGTGEVSTIPPGRTDVVTSSTAPDAPPTAWVGLIGEYGPDDDVWLILENRAGLQALRGEITYLLEDASRDASYDASRDASRDASPHEFFLVPPEAESSGGLIFTRHGEDRASGFRTSGAFFERRQIGAGAGETFRIEPVREVEQLRVEALAASPPREEGTFRASELIDLTSLDRTIRLDVRYATTNNFMSAVFYEDARAFLQRPAAAAVARANQELVPFGYGLLIHDGYRPWYVTKMFWDATPAHQREFVANPASGSRHNRGAAVDLALYDLASGAPVPMPGSYDEFSHRSYSDYPGGTARQRWHRDLLRKVMEAEGFTVNPGEWWHFDYRDWRQYGIQNEVFSEIGVFDEEGQ
jgi:D-alanyl-D-alanine dipeptidase